ncbi:Uma2 family endonuclease [Romeria aff. gracilis LEGE 07310]|uniref:Uma2 family endonuclease n=1 Tax=Vasconcelosia minhoensis LEGE 07310 TaxID=915328 RepID=A0A8J7AQ60_9CYAN|nr:Uma2 family endonuclease [Romeria gracilis]MBE9078316.1 Uma2 family endonuclease [Romeria aff. gracilis LEGE 07310]
MVAAVEPSGILSTNSLEAWLDRPPVGTEWVDGEMIENQGMTLKHSKIQSRLSTLWRNYVDENGLGGEVYTEVPCRTVDRGRSPDVAYLTPDLLAQHGDAKVLMQSFPLIAEIVSPTDFAEDLLTKSQEYLASGSEEVWLVFPENRWVVIVTADRQEVIVAGGTAATQKVLLGFSVLVDKLVD